MSGVFLQFIVKIICFEGVERVFSGFRFQTFVFVTCGSGSGLGFVGCWDGEVGVITWVGL